MEILRMKGSVVMAKNLPVDPETRDYMRDLEKLLVWIDHLEAEDGQGDADDVTAVVETPSGLEEGLLEEREEGIPEGRTEPH